MVEIHKGSECGPRSNLSLNKADIQLTRTSTMQERRKVDMDLLLQAQVLYHEELFPVQPYKIHMHHGYEQEIG